MGEVRTLEEKIEERLDRTIANAVEVSDNLGGIAFKDMGQVLEFAKLMSLARSAVPRHLRDNPGACLAVATQALEWRMSPFAVANKSYEVNDRIAYEAQLIHAVIEARAPLRQRLRFKYDGEGDTLRCTVTGQFKGEVEPVEYQSPPVGKINPKNSPLWKTDPQQQLAYYSARAWARRFAPDVILGIYSDDELDEAAVGADHARDVTPKPALAERLKGGKGKRGFSADGVDKALEHKPAAAAPPEDRSSASPPAETASGDANSKHAEYLEYLNHQLDELKACDTLEAVDGMTQGVFASIKVGEQKGELQMAEASTIRGEWNQAALERKVAIEKARKK